MHTVERICVISLLVAMLGILSVVEAAADLTIYNDRAAWEAALTCPHFLEDFESDVLGSHWTPYTTGNGFLVTSTGAPIEFGIYPNSPIDNTQYIHFRNFTARDIGEGLTFTFPGAALQIGFGFDYHVLDDTWELRVAGQVIIIPANTEGFVGVIDDTGSLASFLFYCGEYVQNGLSVDNVSYSPFCTTPIEQTTWGQVKSLYR